MIKKKVMENSIGQIIDITKVNGLMESNTVKVYTKELMVKRKKVYGKMDIFYKT